MTREEAIEIFKRLKENAPNEMHLETVGTAQELFDMAIQALSQEPCDELVSREAVVDDFIGWREKLEYTVGEDYSGVHLLNVDIQKIWDMPSVTQKSAWIPVSERLPENTYPVNITWVNHDPEPYYAIIKDKPFTATGHYCNGRWWWYSVTCQDYLDEYGHSDVDVMDDAIEVIAWMPLPKPYEPQKSEGDACKDCDYNDGEVHAECVVCDKAESEG